ncbi:MAG: transglycosylase SLT domain-containing protein [Pseudomonadota bacterium]|nr:transglycosylase SLT domain-containing protein [Pseudomonadota bacterium]
MKLTGGTVLGPARTILLTLIAVFWLTPAASKTPEDSIWPRIVAGMQLQAEAQPDAVKWAKHFARHPKAFQTMLARAQPHLWHIVEAAERRKLPLELVLLPAVESGFNANAVSSQHAYGLWQLLPATAGSFGLSSSATYDPRVDPTASTRVALGHLNDMHERFDDWWLAIAAFNIGRGRLAEVMQMQPKVKNFWQLKNLPPETYEHARKLAGICLLIQQPKRFGISLPRIANAAPTELIRLRRPVDLVRVAKAANISEQLIRELNPGLRQLSSTGDKTMLALPAAEAQRFRREMSGQRYSPKPQTAALVHVVQAGESLSHIASRYGVSVATLASRNELSTAAQPRAGSRLQVPTSL